jgi:phosphoglycolate phosphatase
VNKKYINALFDLDGTLTDSAEGVTRSIQYALKMYNISAEADELRAMIGPPLQLAFQRKYGLSEPEAYQAVEYYRDYFRDKGIYENRLYPGIAEMLVNLEQKGMQLFIATSKPTVFARRVLEHFEIDRYFKLIIGSNLDGTRVQKAEVIKAVLNEAGGLEPENTVMIGDREHDIIGAHANNLDSIAVAYGYGRLDELKAAKPSAIVHSVRELAEALQ